MEKKIIKYATASYNKQQVHFFVCEKMFAHFPHRKQKNITCINMLCEMGAKLVGNNKINNS